MKLILPDPDSYARIDQESNYIAGFDYPKMLVSDQSPIAVSLTDSYPSMGPFFISISIGWFHE
jgi:hypothetical protein